jgi:hypothetical protein
VTKISDYTVRVSKQGPDWCWEVVAPDSTIVARGFANSELKARAEGKQTSIDFELGRRKSF